MTSKEKAKIVRAIMDAYDIGLPAANERFKYVSCYGQLEISIEDVKRRFPVED